MISLSQAAPVTAMMAQLVRCGGLGSCTSLLVRLSIRSPYSWMPDMKTSDSDSGHTPSDDEKKVGVEPGAFESLATHQLPPDPDEGLSDHEKANIVSVANDPCEGADGFAGQEASSEA